ncbi:ABC transporter ATP-binding protein [Tanticharoenia sakaeratensis]|nr:ABC transporter ATP-binding protein [Tanticharoenia sakaeratensis]GBQ20506.1 ferrichrome ABC transporter ATP-binding protein [Tanticharoenia sakaeratensis NBRC 103193]
MTMLRGIDIGVRSGTRALLEQVTLDVAPGMLLGLIGPNGAGKTTLLRVLAGLLAPSAGQVLLDARPLSSLPGDARGRAIAYLPQSPELAPGMAVADIVALGRLPHRSRGTHREDARAIERAMARTGVEPFAHRMAGLLSGGERARVALARALAVEAPILLADEPAAALDPAQALGVMALLRDLADAGMAVVIVMHDLALAPRFCTHLSLLHDGRLVASGAPSAVLTDAALHDVYGITARRVGESVVPWSRVS